MGLRREWKKLESRARKAIKKALDQATDDDESSSEEPQKSPTSSKESMNKPLLGNVSTSSPTKLPESGEPSRIPASLAVKVDSVQNTSAMQFPKPVQSDVEDTVKHLISEQGLDDNVKYEQNLSGKQEAVEPETGLTRDSGFNSLSQCMTESDPMHVSDEWSEYGWTLRTSGTCTDDGESTWCANVSGNQIKPDQEGENCVHSHLEQESTDLIIRSLEMDEESLSEYEDANDYMDPGAGTES